MLGHATAVKVVIGNTAALNGGDAAILHATIGILRQTFGDAIEVTGFSTEHRATIEAMTPEQRLEMFSAKNSRFNLGDEV